MDFMLKFDEPDSTSLLFNEEFSYHDHILWHMRTASAPAGYEPYVGGASGAPYFHIPGRATHGGECRLIASVLDVPVRHRAFFAAFRGDFAGQSIFAKNCRIGFDKIYAQGENWDKVCGAYALIRYQSSDNIVRFARCARNFARPIRNNIVAMGATIALDTCTLQQLDSADWTKTGTILPKQEHEYAIGHVTGIGVYLVTDSSSYAAGQHFFVDGIKATGIIIGNGNPIPLATKNRTILFRDDFKSESKRWKFLTRGYTKFGFGKPCKAAEIPGSSPLTGFARLDTSGKGNLHFLAPLGGNTPDTLTYMFIAYRDDFVTLGEIARDIRVQIGKIQSMDSPICWMQGIDYYRAGVYLYIRYRIGNQLGEARSALDLALMPDNESGCAELVNLPFVKIRSENLGYAGNNSWGENDLMAAEERNDAVSNVVGLGIFYASWSRTNFKDRDVRISGFAAEGVKVPVWGNKEK